jgi:hypothetical protein
MADSVLFLFVAMTSIAAALYLPDHISEIARRAFYYWAGEASLANNSTKAVDAIHEVTATITETMIAATNGAV